MTLKDKFDTPIMRHDLGRNEIEETKEQCVEIADEFAVDFAKWLLNERTGFNRETETKKLLEIYKKTL